MVNSNAASAEGDGSSGLSASAMSSDELRDLFTLRSHTMSDTYDSMCADDGSDAEMDIPGDGPSPQERICKEQACPCLSHEPQLKQLDLTSEILLFPINFPMQSMPAGKRFHITHISGELISFIYGPMLTLEM